PSSRTNTRTISAFPSIAAVSLSVLLALFLLALLTSPNLASAQEEHRIFRVPFHTVNGMVLLDATVNDKPAVLLLDTGSDFTLIRSEEHTSELQSRENLVCRLLLEKKKKKQHTSSITNNNLTCPLYNSI